MSNQVIIAGGGIGGFATALTLHQIGVPCLVVEQAADMRPLGVGINLQPNAIRELMALGFTEDDLNTFGLPAQEWALVGLNGDRLLDHAEQMRIGDRIAERDRGLQRQPGFARQRLGRILLGRAIGMAQLRRSLVRP